MRGGANIYTYVLWLSADDSVFRSFVCYPSVRSNPDVHPMLGEKAACAVVSLHLYILSYIPVQCYPPPPAHATLNWGFFFTNGVCREMTTAESNRDMEILTQQTFGFSPSVVAGDK